MQFIALSRLPQGRWMTPNMEDQMPLTGVVIESVAHLFSRPSLTADLVTQAVLGSGLAIKQSQGSWYYVEMPDQYKGWIEARNVRLYAGDQKAYASSGQIAQVTSLIAFLYHQPAVSLRLPALQAAEEYAHVGMVQFGPSLHNQLELGPVLVLATAVDDLAEARPKVILKFVAHNFTRGAGRRTGRRSQLS